MLSYSKLKAGEGAKLWESFKSDLGRAAKRSGFFREDPNKLPATWTAIGVGLMVAVVAFGFLFVFDLSENSELFRPGRGILGLPMLGSIILGVLIIVLSGRLVARTADGARTLAMALGYRNTLRYEMKRAHTVDEAVENTQTAPALDHDAGPAHGLGGRVRAEGRDRRPDQGDVRDRAADGRPRSGRRPGTHGSGGIGSVGSLASSIGSISTSATSSSGSGYGGGGGGGGGGSGGGF